METPFRYGMKSLYIHQLSIEAAYRQQGHGHALMTFVETFAQQQGCQTVELDYWDKNLSAAFFYEKKDMKIYVNMVAKSYNTSKQG